MKILCNTHGLSKTIGLLASFALLIHLRRKEDSASLAFLLNHIHITFVIAFDPVCKKEKRREEATHTHSMLLAVELSHHGLETAEATVTTVWW